MAMLLMSFGIWAPISVSVIVSEVGISFGGYDLNSFYMSPPLSPWKQIDLKMLCDSHHQWTLCFGVITLVVID